MLVAAFFAIPATGRAESVDHQPLTDILSRYVLAGQVDYGGLLKERVTLDRYRDTLHRVMQADYNRWSQKDQMAFWINLYNAETLQMLLDHPHTKSVRSVGWFLSAFREKFIPMPGFVEKQVSLNYIADEILSKRFRDPRFHFALVGAAKSAPRLRSEAYVGAKLDAQLDEQAREFVRDPTKVLWDPTRNTLGVSKMFDWYRVDFDKAGGAVAVVAKYSDPALRQRLTTGPVRLKSLSYDWSLNGNW
jgi:hypothetical protein